MLFSSLFFNVIFLYRYNFFFQFCFLILCFLKIKIDDLFCFFFIGLL